MERIYEVAGEDTYLVLRRGTRVPRFLVHVLRLFGLRPGESRHKIIKRTYSNARRAIDFYNKFQESYKEGDGEEEAIESFLGFVVPTASKEIMSMELEDFIGLIVEITQYFQERNRATEEKKILFEKNMRPSRSSKRGSPARA